MKSPPLLLLLLLPACTERTPSDPSSRSSPAVAGRSVAPSLSLPPLTYFELNCARCHGPYGAHYPREAHWPIDELRETIDLMALGPAAAPIEGADLEAQVALHLAIIANKPFIAWTGRTETGALTGEATPGAELTAESEGRALTITRTGHAWSIEQAPTDATVTLRAGATTLVIPTSAFAPPSSPSGADVNAQR